MNTDKQETISAMAKNIARMYLIAPDKDDEKIDPILANLDGVLDVLQQWSEI